MHNYGASRTGYQVGLSIGIEAVSLALPHLSRALVGHDKVDLDTAVHSADRASL